MTEGDPIRRGVDALINSNQSSAFSTELKGDAGRRPSAARHAPRSTDPSRSPGRPQHRHQRAAAGTACSGRPPGRPALCDAPVASHKALRGRPPLETIPPPPPPARSGPPLAPRIPSRAAPHWAMAKGRHASDGANGTSFGPLPWGRRTGRADRQSLALGLPSRNLYKSYLLISTAISSREDFLPGGFPEETVKQRGRSDLSDAKRRPLTSESHRESGKVGSPRGGSL